MAGAQCCENPPTLSPTCGLGCVVEDLGGLKAYTTGSPDSKLAILLISDVFGFEAPNLRMLADKTAASGFFVVVPDFFYGDPYDDNPQNNVMTWLQTHGTDKGFEDAKLIVAALKNKGIFTVGAAGFCWGAKVVVELAKSNDIKAAVILHPSLVTVEDIKDIKAPIAVLGAEIDKRSPPELLKQFEEVLSIRSEVDGYVKIFPGVVHGWTVRYDVDDEVAVKKAEEAHQDMIEWFLSPSCSELRVLADTSERKAITSLRHTTPMHERDSLPSPGRTNAVIDLAAISDEGDYLATTIFFTTTKAASNPAATMKVISLMATSPSRR